MQEAWSHTDLISDSERCCVLIVASVLKLLVSQVSIIHSSTGNALKHRTQVYNHSEIS